jgi:branched-subunit amino acid transport protein
MKVWLTIIGIGLVTFLFRFTFIWGLERFGEPPWLRPLLKYVPHAALAGLVVAGVFLAPSEAEHALSDPRYPAILAAAIVAYKWGNMLATIATGMIVIWIL